MNPEKKILDCLAAGYALRQIEIDSEESKHPIERCSLSICANVSEASFEQRLKFDARGKTPVELIATFKEGNFVVTMAYQGYPVDHYAIRITTEALQSAYQVFYSSVSKGIEVVFDMFAGEAFETLVLVLLLVVKVPVGTTYVTRQIDNESQEPGAHSQVKVKPRRSITLFVAGRSYFAGIVTIRGRMTCAISSCSLGQNESVHACLVLDLNDAATCVVSGAPLLLQVNKRM